MKKIFTLTLSLFVAAVATFAQEEEIDETFQFVDSEGNVVADGSTLTITEYETHPFLGTIQMPTGLNVKNTTDEEAICGVEYVVDEISNGDFQICFPTNCITQKAPGTYETPSGSLAADEVKDLLSEWLPKDYGTATVSYRLMVYGSGLPGKPAVFNGYGPTVTVNFVYSDPAGVDGVTAAGDVKETARYSLDGRRLSQPEKGINLVKTSDGKVRKVLVNK